MGSASDSGDATAASPDTAAGEAPGSVVEIAQLDERWIGMDEAFVRGVIEASPDAMVVCDDNGRIVLINTQVEVLFGHARAKLVGEPIEALVPHRLQHAHRRHRSGYRADPATRPMGEASQLWGLRDDGSEFAVEIALSPLRVGDGVLTIATIRDTSARRASDAAARDVRRSLDLARDGVVLVAFDTGVVAYANDGFCRLTGYARDELASMNAADLCPDLSIGEVTSFLAPVASGLVESVEFTTTVHRRDLSEVTVEALVQCPPDEHGMRHHFIAVIRDTDERVRRDNDLHDAHEALSIADDRERIARDLHDTVIQRLFAAGLSLVSMTGHLPDDDARRVHALVDQLDDTIRDLRNSVFALGSTRGRELDLRTEIQQLCDDAARVLATAPRLRFDGPIETTPDTVRPHLIAALREALSNIAHHARATSVTVDIALDDQLRLIVTDNGTGLATQVDALPGNGLRNLRDRAAMFGGTFSLTSEPANGTVLSWTVSI